MSNELQTFVVGACFADGSTGRWHVSTNSAELARELALREINKIQPAPVVLVCIPGEKNMSNTQQQPQTPSEQAEVDYGEHLIWRLIGARITSFGGNADGEILLSVRREGDDPIDLVVGKDEAGGIALFEVEKEIVNG